MLSNKFILRASAAAALVCTAGASQAALTLYTSQASFLAAVSGAATDNFDDLPLNQSSNPPTRSVGSYSYNVTAADSAGPDAFFAAGTASDVWLSTNNYDDVVTFSDFTGGVSGIGGLFFGSDVNGDVVNGQTIKLTATDATGSLSFTLTGATPSSFVGFVSTGALTSLDIAAVSPDVATSIWPTVNNLTLATVSAVPEPQSYALLLAGLGVIGLLASRRRS